MGGGSTYRAARRLAGVPAPRYMYPAPSFLSQVLLLGSIALPLPRLSISSQPEPNSIRSTLSPASLRLCPYALTRLAARHDSHPSSQAREQQSTAQCMGSNWTQQTRGGSAGDFLLISTPHTHVFLNCCTTPSQCLPTMPQILPLHHSNQDRSPPDRSLASWGLPACPLTTGRRRWLNLLACSISKPPAGQRSAACSVCGGLGLPLFGPCQLPNSALSASLGQMAWQPP
ncbi:hypothetical protein IWZ01DRAFT_137557 [Phyllosticta capitalensis]